MTVQDLISLLSEEDPDAEVKVYNEYGDYGNVSGLGRCRCKHRIDGSLIFTTRITIEGFDNVNEEIDDYDFE